MGRLGKVQKSSKNKKIKYIDPIYLDGEKQTRSNPFKSKEDVINARPKNETDQEIPRSVLTIMKLKDDTKRGKFKTKIKSKPKKEKQNAKTDYQLLGHLHDEAQLAITKARMEEQFNAIIDTDGNKVTIRKKQKNNEKKKQKTKERTIKKKQAKLNKLDRKKSGFEHLTDKVKFGEIVKQPPHISAQPRRSSLLERKPGKKNLLLKEIISQNSQQQSTRPTMRHLGQSVKRKHLSIAEKRKIDSERERAIDMYRQLKNSKSLTFPSKSS